MKYTRKKQWRLNVVSFNICDVCINQACLDPNKLYCLISFWRLTSWKSTTNYIRWFISTRISITRAFDSPRKILCIWKFIAVMFDSNKEQSYSESRVIQYIDIGVLQGHVDLSTPVWNVDLFSEMKFISYVILYIIFTFYLRPCRNFLPLR